MSRFLCIQGRQNAQRLRRRHSYFPETANLAFEQGCALRRYQKDKTWVFGLDVSERNVEMALGG
jgi:hypothetical protein